MVHPRSDGRMFNLIIIAFMRVHNEAFVCAINFLRPRLFCIEYEWNVKIIFCDVNCVSYGTYFTSTFTAVGQKQSMRWLHELIS